MNLNREYKFQKLLTEEFREERERYMGKVRFSLTDGSAPVKSDGVMMLKAPMDLSLGENTKLPVKLGVTFSVPVVILENPYMVKNGLSVANAGSLVLAGAEPVVNLELQEGFSELNVDRGQTVVFALPLDSNFKLEQK